MIALVCEPVHLRIEQPINSFQREALADPPQAAVAGRQHAGLVATLERLGVEILELSPLPEAPYQVFTRDVVIGGLGDPIVASLCEPLRRPELAAARGALEGAGIGYVDSAGGFLEGGDVVARGREVWVGTGDRTEPAAAAWLAERCGGRFDVRVLEMRPGYLHLDMVFNVLGDESCVWFPDAFTTDCRRLIRDRFRHRVELDAAEQRCRSANFLTVGETAVVASTTVSPAVKKALGAAGRELHLVELGEIQKAGGSVRCATCLL